jgi:hypothetical protein
MTRQPRLCGEKVDVLPLSDMASSRIPKHDLPAVTFFIVSSLDKETEL